MFNLFAIVFNVVTIGSTVASITETIGAIDGKIVIEQNGKQLSEAEPILVTNQNMTARVVIKNSDRFKASYSWFIDDIELRPTTNPEITYRFDTPKVYKVMVVILANETLSETNKSCNSKVGIIFRKVNVVHQNWTKEMKSSNGRLGLYQNILTTFMRENRRRQALETESNTIYGALIIGGAILITLVFISVLIHTISLCDKWLFQQNESKKPLIDKNAIKFRTYTP